jgi:hypothetical protein
MKGLKSNLGPVVTDSEDPDLTGGFPFKGKLPYTRISAAIWTSL